MGRNGPEVSFYAVAEEGKIGVVTSLLEQGINLNSRDASIDTIRYCRAAAKGIVDVVRFLIERGAEWIHIICEGGRMKSSRMFTSTPSSRGLVICFWETRAMRA
jgi:hypothetical protein